MAYSPVSLPKMYFYSSLTVSWRNQRSSQGKITIPGYSLFLPCFPFPLFWYNKWLGDIILKRKIKLERNDKWSDFRDVGFGKKNAVHDLVYLGAYYQIAEPLLMLFVFCDFIPKRVARCQLGFVAADSHTSLLFKNKTKNNNKRKR